MQRLAHQPGVRQVRQADDSQLHALGDVLHGEGRRRAAAGGPAGAADGGAGQMQRRVVRCLGEVVSAVAAAAATVRHRVTQAGAGGGAAHFEQHAPRGRGEGVRLADGLKRQRTGAPRLFHRVRVALRRR